MGINRSRRQPACAHHALLHGLAIPCVSGNAEPRFDAGIDPPIAASPCRHPSPALARGHEIALLSKKAAAAAETTVVESPRL
jgi:hypothetical protein